MQFVAIIRAQEITFVESKEDKIKVTTKERSDDFGTEASCDYHFAWDRQALFMNAQSKVLAELEVL